MTFNVPGAKFNLMAFNRPTFIEEEEEPLPFSTTIPFYLVSRTTELDAPIWELQRRINNDSEWSKPISISFNKNLYFILKYPGHYRLMLNGQTLEEFYVYEFFVNFDANLITGVAPLTVQFNNLSNALEFMFNEYTWYYSHEDDPDNWIEFSKLVAPEHIFKVPGKYNIRLDGNSPYDMNKQSIIKNNFIDVKFNHPLEFNVINQWGSGILNYKIIIINSRKNEIYAILENENSIVIDEEGIFHAFILPHDHYSAYSYPALKLYDPRRNLISIPQAPFERKLKYKFKIMDESRSYSQSTNKVNLSLTASVPTITNFNSDYLMLSIRCNNIYNINELTSHIKVGDSSIPFSGIRFYEFAYRHIYNNYSLIRIPLNKFHNINRTKLNQSLSIEIDLLNGSQTFALDVNGVWIESENNYSGWTLSSNLYSQLVKYNNKLVNNCKIYCINPSGDKIKDVAYTNNNGEYNIYATIGDILLAEPQEELTERPKLIISPTASIPAIPDQPEPPIDEFKVKNKFDLLKYDMEV